MNQSAFPTVIVCPITTRKRAAFGWRPGLEPDDLRIADETWTPRPHWVMTDQVVTLDRTSRATRHLATVASDSGLAAIDASLRQMLDL